MKLPLIIVISVAITIIITASYVVSAVSLNRICAGKNECNVSESPLLVTCLLLALAGTIYCFWNALKSIEYSDNNHWDIYVYDPEEKHMDQSSVGEFGWVRIMVLTVVIGMIFIILVGFYAYGDSPGYYGWNWIAGLLHIGTSQNIVLICHPRFKRKDYSHKR